MTKPILWLLIFLTSVSYISIHQAHGQGPRGFQFLKSKIGGPRDVALKAENGPWLIYAYSLEGSDSKMQALKLTAELREDFGLNAYIVPKTFDFSTNVVGSGIVVKGFNKETDEPIVASKVMKYSDDRIVESYSIVIGDYASSDLPETREALAKIKTIRPKFFETESFASTIEEVTPGEKARAFSDWLSLNKGKKSKEELAKAGPMHSAFLIRNPLLPQDYFDAPEMDSFVTGLNKKADHSILSCPGRFTVRVANFTGGAQMMIGGANPRADESNALAKAAEQAHVLADLLRKGGVEAYEYHDRTCSSVCVGSFDELGALDSEGQFVYAPAIMQVVQDYGGSKGYEATKYGPLPKAKTLLDVVSYKKYPELTTGSEKQKLAKVKEYTIAFDVTPKPIFVPKPQSQSLYRKALLGRR
jgi:hypothetical protein